MAEELLVSDQLTPEMVRAGAALIESLDHLHVIVRAGFWLLLPDQRLWRLFIATPEVKTVGPKAIYRKIASALRHFPPTVQHIGAKDVTVLEDTHPLVALLRPIARTGPGISGIRMSRNVVNGQLIEDAFLYRMR